MLRNSSAVENRRKIKERMGMGVVRGRRAKVVMMVLLVGILVLLGLYYAKRETEKVEV